MTRGEAFVEDARALMLRAHAGQTRKDGKTPYSRHPEQVRGLVMTLAKRTLADMQVAALLHDVVEDTPVTLNEIRIQFGDVVADAVDALSRRPGESYVQYLFRVAAAPDWVRDIKGADVLANLRDLDNAGDAGWAERYRKMKNKFLTRVDVSAPLAEAIRAEMTRLAGEDKR